MEKIDKAWILFLNSTNYYTLTTMGLYYDLLQVKTKYPVYCVVTENVSGTDKNILKKIGLNLIEVNTKNSKIEVLKSNFSNNVTNWKNAFAKLLIIGNDFTQKFNKICYIDTDVRIFKNMDAIFEYPHMSAVEDCAPVRKGLHQKYTLGCSIFCSGLFIWDYENHPNEGEEILDKLNTLNKNITWHDQSVLNYFYQEWKDKEELHIHPKYCLMNVAKNLELIGLDNICAIHYVNRNKDNWPFNTKTTFKTKLNTSDLAKFGFKSWVENIGNAIKYFNNKYKLNIMIPNSNNITELTREDYIKDVKKARADGKPGCYLYF